MAANVAEVTDDPKTKADENLAEVEKVAASIGDAAGSTLADIGDNVDGDNNSTTNDGTGNCHGATVAWPANTPANPDADPPTKEVPMYRTVTITNVQGGNIVSVIDKQQVDANDPKDGDYDDAERHEGQRQRDHRPDGLLVRARHHGRRKACDRLHRQDSGRRSG